MDEQTGDTEIMMPEPISAEDFLEKYTHCALCGSHLHVQHFTDFVRNLTQETAKCPECGVHARRVMHTLQ